MLRAALDLEGPLGRARARPPGVVPRVSVVDAPPHREAPGERDRPPRARTTGRRCRPAHHRRSRWPPRRSRRRTAPRDRPGRGRRVCFVGDPARHRAHAPLDGTALDACFVSAPSGPDATALAAIREFRPDVTVVFVPERLTPATAAEIPGTLVGVVTTVLGPEAYAHLRQTFPLEASDRPAYLVHPDVEAQARLLAGGVNAVAALPAAGRRHLRAHGRGPAMGGAPRPRPRARGRRADDARAPAPAPCTGRCPRNRRGALGGDARAASYGAPGSRST